MISTILGLLQGLHAPSVDIVKEYTGYAIAFVAILAMFGKIKLDDARERRRDELNAKALEMVADKWRESTEASHDNRQKVFDSLNENTQSLTELSTLIRERLRR